MTIKTILAFVLFSSSSFTCKKNTDTRPFSEKSHPQLLEQYMQAQMKLRGFSGTVLVMKNKQMLLKKGYGMADIESHLPNATETKFRIGSISKQFTAACILQLVDTGKLSLDDKLSKFYPDYPRGNEVTIHMLLNHTSGILSPSPKELTGKIKSPLSQDHIISLFKNEPYNFYPGTKFSYSNSGYFLLSCIIEKVGGLPYEKYLQKNIFEKLGMKNSGLDTQNMTLAKGYSGSGKEINEYASLMKLAFGAGALYSTADDLYKWDRALYENTILTNKSKRKMFTPGKGNNQEGGYGYGVFIQNLETHRRIWHSGSLPGFKTNISRFIDDDLCIIVLSNNESFAMSISEALASILFDLPVEMPYQPQEVKISSVLLNRYVGKYSSSKLGSFELVKKDDKLYLCMANLPELELKPQSETKFFLASDNRKELAFEVDPIGKTTKTWNYMNGFRIEEIRKLD